jgi:hypothetical protein
MAALTKEIMDKMIAETISYKDRCLSYNPLNQENEMPKVKPPKKDYNTIAVRFLFGDSDLSRTYTYKIAKKVKVHLGQLLVSPPNSSFQRGICAVVEIHKEPQDTKQGITYKFISDTLKPI